MVLTAGRQKDDEKLKYILFWNEAYGSKEYDLGFGRQPFYDNLCPETRCFATDNRDMIPVDQFDAVFFHQRSLDFNDLPAKRNVGGKKISFSFRQKIFVSERAEVCSLHHGVSPVSLHRHQ